VDIDPVHYMGNSREELKKNMHDVFFLLESLHMFLVSKNYIPKSKNKDGTRKKVFVGVSGGVDSSVSLALLRDAGFDVTGVFIKVYHPDFLGCSWRDERLDALAVCQRLGVQFLDLDLEKEYKQDVFDYMIEGYKAGITPNPDVFCNKYVKFGGFLDFAIDNGADFVATGHYAKHVYDKKNDIHEMHKGLDGNKDQTYFLYQMSQEKLEKVLFPIGGYPKSKVRKLAAKYGLLTADKKDSQGLCFVGDVKMKDFLQEYIDKNPGDVLNEEGEVIGSHDGAIFYTRGERHGYKIFPKAKTPDMPRLFVIKRDIENNTIAVGPKESLQEIDRVNGKEILIHDCHWVSGEPEESVTYTARVRYRGELLSCKLKKSENGAWLAHFDTSHRSVARGQSLVIYLNEVCIGGGIIS